MLNKSNLVAEPIEKGDAGVILKSNGTVKVFTSADYPADPDQLTDDQLEQGRRLQALALVAGNEELMQQILKIVDDLNEAGVDILEVHFNS